MSRFSRFRSTFPNLKSGLGQGFDGIQSVAEELAKSIHAYQNICATAAKHTRDTSVYRYFEGDYEKEIRAKSLELAINFRVWDEKAGHIEEWKKIVAQVTSGHLGKMVEPNEEPLSIREACNKIIHAKQANFQTVRYQVFGEKVGAPVYVIASGPLATLLGEKYRKPWKCEIDFLELSICCHEAVDRWISGQF